MGEFAAAYKLIASGKYGRLLGGHFKRIISEPKWIADFFDPARVGGPMVDLHIHDAHFIRLLCGMPKSVFTTGRLRDGVAEFFTTQFRFDDADLAITATSGVIHQQGRPFTHGFEIHCERATLVFDFAVVGGEARVQIPLTVFPARGEPFEAKLGSADPLDAFAAELAETVRSVRTGQPSPLLSGTLAREALILCEKQTASLAAGRPVKV
jgi:predicted dehydrogenase